MPAWSVSWILFLTSVGAACTCWTSWAISWVGVIHNAWPIRSSLKHPAYVGVHQELQAQVVLDQAFIEAAIATDSCVSPNKDSSTTTICVKEEYQRHKQCQSIYPSLSLLNFHFSVPLLATWSSSTISHTVYLERGILILSRKESDD